MSLRGSLVPPRRQFDLDMRKGIPGIQITDLQKHGVPFTLHSIVDCASYVDGQSIFNDYLEIAVGGGIVSLVQSDYDTAIAGWQVKVLDCRMLALQQAKVIVGGLQYSTGFILSCEWDLIGEEV